MKSKSPISTKITIYYNAPHLRSHRVKNIKRPEGMHREVYALLYNDNKDAPPLLPTDTGAGYIQVKARLGMKKVRKWEWSPFSNPARTDSAVFHHWRRAADEPKEYPFAQFNKPLSIPTYTPTEYNLHLKSNTLKWSKAQTDHLFELARRFDMRFVIMADRWDHRSYGTKSVEDLKERYYEVANALQKAQQTAAAAAAATPSPLLLAQAQSQLPQQQQPPPAPPAPPADKKPFLFDAEHERKRKEQLRKLFDRTPKQIEEEQMLLNELKKIEARKRERDRKTQDLQKLISQADQQGEAAQPPNSARKHEKKQNKKAQKNTAQTSRPSRVDSVVNVSVATTALSSGPFLNSRVCICFPKQAVESAGIKFNELRGTGVSLRSTKMKLPTNVGQKKSKALDMALAEFRVGTVNRIRSGVLYIC